MTLTDLGILSAAMAVLALYILTRAQAGKGAKEVTQYIAIGLIAAAVDLAVELTGTIAGAWEYAESAWFLFGTVPAELVLIFFSGGVIIRHVYVTLTGINHPIRSNTFLSILALVGTLIWIRGTFFLDAFTTLLFVAVPAGLWGWNEIKSEKNRVSALTLGLIVAVIDAILELIIVGRGGYDYVDGFTWDIPLAYFMLMLVAAGVMERMNKLDAFFEHPIIRNLLRGLGIRRDRYKNKIKTIENRIKDRVRRK